MTYVIWSVFDVYMLQVINYYDDNELFKSMLEVLSFFWSFFYYKGSEILALINKNLRRINYTILQS